MVFNIIGLLVGLMILVGSLAYVLKEKNDKEARKIYAIFALIGGLIVAVMIIKMLIG